MSTVVLKLFAGQGTGRTDRLTDGRTDGQSGDYMLRNQNMHRNQLSI